MDKQLKKKAIDIKGKEYVMVKDRVVYFNKEYPSASVVTEMWYHEPTNAWIASTKVYPDSKDKDRYFTGHSQAVIGAGMINKTSAMENAETSAVGRALAFMGIGVIDSIASGDEINKAVGTKVEVKDKSLIDDTEAAKLKEFLETNKIKGALAKEVFKEFGVSKCRDIKKDDIGKVYKTFIKRIGGNVDATT